MEKYAHYAYLVEVNTKFTIKVQKTEARKPRLKLHKVQCTHRKSAIGMKQRSVIIHSEN